MKMLEISLGDAARKHIEKNGLSPADISVIPGAAGGPKGLILQGLDKFLFSEWLSADALKKRAETNATPLQLIGASIGAWRMAAASMQDPVAGFTRLADQYCEAQRYPKGVKRPEITQVCQRMVEALVADTTAQATSPKHKQLLIWVNKGRQALFKGKAFEPSKRGFAFATLANAISRHNIHAYLERWVFHTGDQPPAWLQAPFDGAGCEFQPLNQHNLAPALLASGSIPFVLDAVEKIPSTTSSGEATTLQGPFWDGGLTDYHLALPYQRQTGLVLYPHFSDSVTPGWLDKFLKKRKANPDWMSNVILLYPSAQFVQNLPAKKIPDRSDFKRYGLDHDLRIKHWREAISASDALAEEFQRWLIRSSIDQKK